MKRIAFTLAEVLFPPAEQSKKIASRIIRVVAGVTSRFNSRAGALRAAAHLSHNNSLDCCVRQSRNFGFTLAEVLITLGIIGVVAALTMPSLIQKYQDQVTVNKLKKMYSVLNNAYNLYKLEGNHEFIEWSPEGAEKAFSIFKPYLKVAKDCGVESGEGCIYSGGYKYLTNAELAISSYSSNKNYYKVRLTDGSSLIFRGGTVENDANLNLEVFYDVNGEKGPNTWGKDLFEFDVAFNNNLYPQGISPKVPSGSCGIPEAKGWGCTAWVLYNENLDYLHCDGLSWEGKRKCK